MTSTTEAIPVPDRKQREAYLSPKMDKGSITFLALGSAAIVTFGAWDVAQPERQAEVLRSDIRHGATVLGFGGETDEITSGRIGEAAVQCTLEAGDMGVEKVVVDRYGAAERIVMLSGKEESAEKAEALEICIEERSGYTTVAVRIEEPPEAKRNQQIPDELAEFIRRAADFITAPLS